MCVRILCVHVCVCVYGHALVCVCPGAQTSTRGDSVSVYALCMFGGAILPPPLCPQFCVPGPHPGPARAGSARGGPPRPREAALGGHCSAQTIPSCCSSCSGLQTFLGKWIPVPSGSSCRSGGVPVENGHSVPQLPTLALAVHGPAPLSPNRSPAACPTLGVTWFSQGGQRLAGWTELWAQAMYLLCPCLGHARRQQDAYLGIAMPIKCPRASCRCEPHTH